MITFENVTKSYKTRTGVNTVLNNINLYIEKGDRIGILGHNGSGKSTLIRLLGGIELPDNGTITRNMSVSWPLAFSGAFQGSLTGFDNVRFICRIYDARINDIIANVIDFAGLGEYLYEPVKNYSSGMKARLAFALSMSIKFDCYLIDEIMSVGDRRFKKKCNYEIRKMKYNSSIILVSHSYTHMKKYCDRFFVLKNGNIKAFKKAANAFSYYDKVTQNTSS